MFHSLLFSTTFCSLSTDPPKITYVVGNQTANVKDEVSLDCTADGNPAPSITWTRLSDNSVVSSPLTITGKHDEGYYRCTADNGISSPDSRDVFVTVQSKFKLFGLPATAM